MADERTTDPTTRGAQPGTARRVRDVVAGVRTLEGAGFAVRRPFPTAALAMVDPFLLLDELGPVELAPGEAKGAPDHPHRGFETVTYLLEGEMEHRDSVGNHGRLTPGDVQWMTAGAGVVHSEMPARDLLERGGRLHGFQLWVNLPRTDKLQPPRYQDLAAAEIPTVAIPGGSATVIAGAAFGAVGPAETHVPITYVHLRLEPLAAARLTVGRDASSFAYVVDGGGRFGVDGVEAGAGDCVVFGAEGDDLGLVAGDGGLDVLVFAGQPLREPVVRYGPFVMSTKAEILEAVDDFQSGRMGRIGA